MENIERKAAGPEGDSAWEVVEDFEAPRTLPLAHRDSFDDWRRPSWIGQARADVEAVFANTDPNAPDPRARLMQARGEEHLQ